MFIIQLCAFKKNNGIFSIQGGNTFSINEFFNNCMTLFGTF